MATQVPLKVVSLQQCAEGSKHLAWHIVYRLGEKFLDSISVLGMLLGPVGIVKKCMPTESRLTSFSLPHNPRRILYVYQIDINVVNVLHLNG
jgi:hypothetical protein